MDNLFDLYDLRITVDEIRGKSVCGMAVGDYFEITESSKIRIPVGKHFCMYALNSVIPLISAKQRNLSENDWLTKDSHAICPDPEEGLVMIIERIGKRTMNRDDLT
ncbi:MAG: TIGR04076 family protein [Phototrophicaceae bacterium]